MHSNLQPKVAFGQQLIRAKATDTLQPMVATDDEIRAGFSKRLANALKESARAPDDPRAWRPWMAKRYGVSQEAARKWLSGMAIPEMAKLAKIAVDLDKAADYLLTGRGAGEINLGVRLSADEDEVLTHYRKSPDFGRSFIRKVAETSALPARILLADVRRGADTGGRLDEPASSSEVKIGHIQVVAEAMLKLGKDLSTREQAKLFAKVYSMLANDEKKPTVAAVLRLLRSA